MEHEQFTAILPYISFDLVAMIAREQKLTEDAAVIKLYDSVLYAYLERENTKLWQYSTPMLYSLFLQGENNGKIEFPDT